MSDLKQLIHELANRPMTRKQFLAHVGGSFLGMIGFFRFLQSVNTPDLATSDRGVFGEKEYGHPETANKAAKAKSFDSEAFG